MKATNQFDYPSRAAQSFKTYHQQDMIDTRQKTNYQKTKYKQHMNQVKQSQRLKVQTHQQKKMEQQKEQNKLKIRLQLQKKKKQLEELQKFRQQAQENQRRSYELAIIKEQQDKIKKVEDQKRIQQNQQNAEARFQMALKRLDQQKQQASYKERLAEQRRKAAQQVQKIERQKAAKYKEYLQQKQKNKIPQVKVTFEEYKQNLGRSTYNKNIDYTKTCLHNPKIIVEKTQQQKQNAFQQGTRARQYIKEKSEEKRRSSQQNHQKSLERGKQALLKIQRQKQHIKYSMETSEQQKKYNLQRLKQGKKNQYTGIKPTTLQQMEKNKKQRGQQQFNKMFFQAQVVSDDRFNRDATKYQIVQARMAPKKYIQTEVSFKKQKKYLNKKQQSQIPCVSQGKYQFQEEGYSQFSKSSRSQNQTGHIQQQDLQNQEQNRPEFVYPQMISNTKQQLKQTGLGFQKSVQSNLNQIKPIIKQNYEKHSRNSQKQFDTEQMLRKYGIKKGSPESKSKGRKVVGMSNICQNKQKEELSYSESEDSFM